MSTVLGPASRSPQVDPCHPAGRIPVITTDPRLTTDERLAAGGNGAARAIVDIITGTWRAQALHAAVALGIPDHIAAGHTGTAELAVQTGATEDGVERLMRLLVSMGVFGRDHCGYRPTEVSELLRAGVPGSLRDMVQIYGEEFHRAWGSFGHAIVTGRSGFEDAFGCRLSEYLAGQPAASEKFLRAMNAGSAFFAEVPAVFDFRRCATVVDVAGGSGALLATVLRASPATHGVLFDLPHATLIAGKHLGDAFPADRFDVLTGDMFEAVPPGGDAYLLSRVLQDWDDRTCITLLSHCRDAMSDSARLLILERVIPDDDSLSAARQLPLLWDLHLLTMTGGRQRTLHGYRSILGSAGLRLETVHSLPLETNLLVAAC
ncbi:MAG: methyltransferase [Pseudonocardiaceae bacterium]